MSARDGVEKEEGGHNDNEHAVVNIGNVGEGVIQCSEAMLPPAVAVAAAAAAAELVEVVQYEPFS